MEKVIDFVREGGNLVFWNQSAFAVRAKPLGKMVFVEVIAVPEQNTAGENFPAKSIWIK